MSTHRAHLEMILFCPVEGVSLRPRFHFRNLIPLTAHHPPEKVRQLSSKRTRPFEALSIGSAVRDVRKFNHSISKDQNACM